ncbi:MAG TPA: haloacid dehalogenase-like hydrolase [Terracidiphilus sp.]
MIVDLCGTIIAENTTNGFLDSWLLKQGWRRRVRHVLGGKRPFSVLALRGLAKSLLYEEADLYVQDRLSTLVNPAPVRAIREAQSHGDPVYLATASLDPIAAAVARQLQLDGVITSRLDYDRHNRCSGLFALDVTGHKLAHLRGMLPETLLRAAAVYTDNCEDRDLLRICARPHFLGKPNTLSGLSDAELARISFLS